MAPGVGGDHVAAGGLPGGDHAGADPVDMGVGDEPLVEHHRRPVGRLAPGVQAISTPSSAAKRCTARSSRENVF